MNEYDWLQRAADEIPAKLAGLLTKLLAGAALSVVVAAMLALCYLLFPFFRWGLHLRFRRWRALRRRDRRDGRAGHDHAVRLNIDA
jgi:hypothetical protein